MFNEVYDSIDEFKFDNIILNENEKKIANNLLNEKYHNVNCSEIAMILPKLIKCTNFEDGHFVHIRNYLLHEKIKNTYIILFNYIESTIFQISGFRQYR